MTHPVYILSNLWAGRHLIFKQDANNITGFSTPAPDDGSVTTHPGTAAPFVYGATLKLSAGDYLPLLFLILIAVFYAFSLVKNFQLERSWPIVLAAFGLSNAILGFFGDVWQTSDMERHALIGSVLLRTGLLCCLLFFADDLYRRYETNKSIPRT